MYVLRLTINTGSTTTDTGHDTNNISYLHHKEYASCLRSLYLLIAIVCLGNALSTTQTHTSPSKQLNNYAG